MPWKWLFLCLLLAGGGIVWQNEDARRELFRELQLVQKFLNGLGDQYEPWQVMFVSAGLTLLAASTYTFLFREDETLGTRAKRAFFRFVRSIPPIRAKIDREIHKALATTFAPKPGETFRTVLPKKGLSRDEVLKEASALEKLGSIKWLDGSVSGTLYNCSPELTSLTTEVFRKFVWVNPLHTDVFPYIRKMEAEVVQWCVDIFNGGKEACGCMTSGGTESILMAMRTYRQIGYDRGIEFPEIICSVSAHSAFMKAADYFRMKITRVSVDPQTRMVSLKAMSGAISKNTVVLVASAPQYPHGIVDPVEDVARLARRHGIGVHVDCCLGSFIVPFIEKAGFEMEPFDFRVKGVTSISADTHKYGYSPKGTSVVLYANKELRHKQYFVDPKWQGGIYGSPTLAGSRPGSLIAATWATMMHIGMDGYVEATKKIVTTARKIMDGLKKIPGLYVFGTPKASVVAFGSKDFDIYRLSTAMSERGWYLNSLQYPSGIHICVTMLHTQKGVAERFLKDVRESTAEIMRNPKAKVTGMGAMYGMAQGLPNSSDLVHIFFDLCLRAEPPADGAQK